MQEKRILIPCRKRRGDVKKEKKQERSSSRRTARQINVRGVLRPRKMWGGEETYR